MTDNTPQNVPSPTGDPGGRLVGRGLTKPTATMQIMGLDGQVEAVVAVGVPGAGDMPEGEAPGQPGNGGRVPGGHVETVRQIGSPDPSSASVLPQTYSEQLNGQVVATPPQSTLPQQAVLPPTQKVTFEIPNWGPMEVFYHRVTRCADFIVLMHDTRVSNSKPFPRVSEHPLAMHVDGTDKLFLVSVTKYQFDLGTTSICLLDIRGEGSLSESQNKAEVEPFESRPPWEVPNHDGKTSGDRPEGDAGGEEDRGGPQVF